MFTALKLILVIAVLASMCAEGMRISPADLTTVWRRPSKLARGVVAVVVLVPIMAVLTVALVHPSRAVTVALAFLAASPLAPFILTKIAKSGEDFRLGASLHVALAALSTLTAPIALVILGRVLDFPTAFAPPRAIAARVFLSLLAPFGVGVGLRVAAPRLAGRLQRVLEVGGAAVLLVAVLALLVGGRHLLLEFGVRDYAAMALFCALALAGGHLMAAHDDERTIYALESAARNPGVALFMATASLGPVRGAVLLPYLVVFVLVSTAYSAVRKRAIAHRAGRPSAA